MIQSDQGMYGMSVVNSGMNSFYAGKSLYGELSATNLTQLVKSLFSLYNTSMMDNSLVKSGVSSTMAVAGAVYDGNYSQVASQS